MPLTVGTAVVKRLYVEEQRTLREIATLLGTTWKRVGKVLRENGVTLTRGKRLTSGRGVRYKKIAESSAGRSLVEGEVVHHLDVNFRNNDPTNLVIVTRKRHGALHQQLQRISGELFKRGLVTYDELSGYRMSKALEGTRV